MSRRPTNVKRANRVRKAFRRTPPAYFDVSRWLIDHGHASGTRQAIALIADGRVSADSHKLTTIHAPAELRGHVTVSSEA